MPLPIVEYRNNAEFVRSYFRSHPAATVREAVRAASQARRGMHWEEVSRLHRELLPELRTLGAALQQQLQPLTVRPHPPLPQKPRTPVEILREAVPLAPPPKPEAPKSTEAAAQPTGEKMAPRKPVVPPMEVSPEDLKVGRNGRLSSAVAMRRKSLNAYLEKHPNVSAKVCKEALERTFGIGLMMTYIQDTVRLSRQVRDAPPVKPAPAVAPAAPPAPQAAAPLPSPPPPPPAAPAPVQAATPVPAFGPEAYPALQWGPPPVRDTLEMKLRELATRLKAVAEEHGVSSASLVLGPERKVSISVVRATTLEA